MLRTLVFSGLVLTLSHAPVRADITYNFDDGSTTGFTTVGATVSNGLDSGSLALKVTTTATFQSALGTMPSITLANVGDSVKVQFQMRFDSAPGADAAGFRFGLHNTLGTVSTDDDKGYYFAVSTGGTKSHGLYRENGGTSPILAGNDRAQLGSLNATAASIADTVQHSYSLTITKTSATAATLTGSVDGVNYFTSVNDSAAVYTFNQIGFSDGSTARSFWIDNVVVTFAAVPEPSSFILGLTAVGAGLWSLKRRRFTTMLSVDHA